MSNHFKFGAPVPNMSARHLKEAGAHCHVSSVPTKETKSSLSTLELAFTSRTKRLLRAACGRGQHASPDQNGAVAGLTASDAPTVAQSSARSLGHRKESQKKLPLWVKDKTGKKNFPSSDNCFRSTCFLRRKAACS